MTTQPLEPETPEVPEIPENGGEEEVKDPDLDAIAEDKAEKANEELEEAEEE